MTQLTCTECGSIVDANGNYPEELECNCHICLRKTKHKAEKRCKPRGGRRKGR